MDSQSNAQVPASAPAAAPAQAAPAQGAPSPQAQEFARDLIDFVAASPSSYHAAAEGARRLVEAGFTELSEHMDWELPAGGYFVRRDGALIAWIQGENAPDAFDIVGAHTDSPGFKLKPQPTIGGANTLQAGVEVYGGPLINSWPDRELRLAGRLALLDGREVLVATEAIFRIPHLAIHLNRSSNSEGIKLDAQQHTQPIWGLGLPTQADLLAHIASCVAESEVDAAEIGGYDLLTVDGARGAFFGAQSEFLASGRLDNLTGVHAGLTALIARFESLDAAADLESLGRSPMLAAFDHEELGSETRSGAAGPFLEDVLIRILGERGPRFSQAMAASTHLSVDAGHAVNPNYPGHHDPNVRPYLGGGVLLKINANQRYATDAVGAALAARLAAESSAAVQEFVSNNTMPCGSTIGPITATRLGIRTVDVGVPLLSMHSAREMLAVQDHFALGVLAKAFLAQG